MRIDKRRFKKGNIIKLRFQSRRRVRIVLGKMAGEAGNIAAMCS